MTIQQAVIPLGEFAPDVGQFGSGEKARLIACRNLVPVYGNYCAAPAWAGRTAGVASSARGLHALSTGPGTFLAYFGEDTKLWRVTPTGGVWTVLDVSRLAGGAYNTAGAGGENGWQFTAFGRSEIATNYVDDPQLLVSGTANFVKLAQSGGGNPGMDPKAKFVWSMRNNLFLANCNLAALYDGLASGAHPNLVVWSQSDVITQFGSFNADPQLIGSGYQEILNDYGDITGGVGGDDFSIVTQERAMMRIDGPPYQFRSVVTGVGCSFPNALRRFGADVYGWGPGGPFVLRGGEGPIIYLGDGKLIRTIIDNTTTFSPSDSILPGINVRHVSLAVDPTNRMLQYSLTTRGRGTESGTSAEGNHTIWYNIAEDRFSFAESSVAEGGSLGGVLYLCNRPDTGESWMPGRTALAILQSIDAGGAKTEFVGTPFLSDGASFRFFPLITKPYIQLDPKLTTRVLRLRLVYSSGISMPLTCKVSIASKNKTYTAPVVSGVFSTVDSHGWVVTPTAVYADFHSFSIELGAGGEDLSDLTELAAIEVEFQPGPRYAE